MSEKFDNLEIPEKLVSTKHDGKDVERESILRQIRYEKRSTTSDIKELQFAQIRKDHIPKSSDDSLVSKTKSKKKSPPELKMDSLDVDTGDQDKLQRLEAILSKGRYNIEKRKDALETLLQMNEDYLSEEERTAKIREN